MQPQCQIQNRKKWLQHDLDDDQKRVMSPIEAYKKGADFIVVGRPITKSEDPRKALELFL